VHSPSAQHPIIIIFDFGRAKSITHYYKGSISTIIYNYNQWKQYTIIDRKSKKNQKNRIENSSFWSMGGVQ